CVGAGCVWAGLENVPEMPLAGRAQHLGPGHEEAPVRLGADGGRVDGLPEGRPSRARVELGARCEEWRAAPRALVRARFLGVVVLAGERVLRAVPPQDLVLLRRQAVAPLLVGLAHSCALLVAHRSPSLP